MAEEASDPGSDVPKAVNLVLIAVLGVYMGISVVALSALPVVHHGVGYSPAQTASTPATRPRSAGTSRTSRCSGSSTTSGCTARCCTVAQYYVGLLAATILFIATNAGLIGISRLSWSLAEHRQLPSIFSRLHPTYRTPWFTIVFFSGFAGAADPLRQHQRARQPLLVRRDAVVHDRARRRSSRCASRTPTASGPTGCRGNVRIRGAQIPITAVVGGIGTFAAWVAVVALHPEAQATSASRGWSSGWAATSSIASARARACGTAYRDRARRAPAGLPASSATARRWCRSSAATSARTALVSAAKLIGEDGIVYAIFVLPVPRQLSLDAGLEEEEALGRSILESARIQARRAGHQDPHRPDPHAQPRRGARRRGAAGRRRRDLLSTLHAPAGEQRIGPTAVLPARASGPAA